MTIEAPAGRLTVEFASSPEQVREAQRLRYDVFADELGARLKSPTPGLDIDAYDAHCEHLLVRETETGEIVACTRALLDTVAAEWNGFYSESEFDLRAVLGLEGRMLEIGRTCVRKDWRGGATIAVLWSGLAKLVRQHRVAYLIGCASVPLDDGFGAAAAMMEELRAKHFAPAHVRVRPRLGLPANAAPSPAGFTMPPLLKAYLRMGGLVCGEAFWDKDFNVADVFMLVRLAQMNPRYARHFL